MPTPLPVLPELDRSYFNCYAVRAPEQAMLDRLDEIIAQLEQEMRQGVKVVDAPTEADTQAIENEADKILNILRALRVQVDNLLGHHAQATEIRTLNHMAAQYFRLVREMYFVMAHYQQIIAELEDPEEYQFEGLVPMIAAAEEQFRKSNDLPVDDHQTMLQNTAETIRGLQPKIENAAQVEGRFDRVLDAFMKINKGDTADPPGVARLEAVRQAVNASLEQFEGLSNTLAKPYMKQLVRAVRAYEREDYIPMVQKFKEIQTLRNDMLKQIILFSGRELPPAPDASQKSDSCPSEGEDAASTLDFSDSDATEEYEETESGDDSDDASTEVSSTVSSSRASASLFQMRGARKRDRSDDDLSSEDGARQQRRF